MIMVCSKFRNGIKQKVISLTHFTDSVVFTMSFTAVCGYTNFLTQKFERKPKIWFTMVWNGKYNATFLTDVFIRQ